MFDTMYLGVDGVKHHVWQTSWGVSTRLIGALIMTHSDDAGLVLPPRLAPVHAAIIVIGKTPEDRAKVKARAEGLAADLRKVGLGVLIDDDESKSPGWKYAEYELRGVCLRVELGPKDLEKGQCVLVRRDTKVKEPVSLEAAVDRARAVLDQMQQDLFDKALAFRQARTFEVDSYDELKARADQGFLLAHWDGTAATEARIKEETGLTTRNRPLDLEQTPGTCVVTGQPSPGRIVFSKAY
jgi:prolyl-tRNA synthetase